MKFKFIFAGCTAALTLAACATKPEPIVEPVEVPVAVAPAPVAPAPIVAAPAPAPAPIAAPQAYQPIPGSVEDFAFRSGGEARVFFGYDRFDLSQEARDALRSQAQWLTQYETYTAVVEGHADERGTREYNLALGARRAESVKSFLVSQGVSPSRLTTVSYGKERPIDGRSSEAGWARNRNGFTNLTLNGQS